MTKNLIRAGVVLGLVATMLSACGTGGDSRSSSPTALTIATNYMPSTTDVDPKDPADGEFASVVSTNLGGTLFSHLGDKVDPATASPVPPPGPGLATTATYDAGTKTMTVRLRPNVRSSANNPLTADDVVWTVQRAMNTNLYGKAMLLQANVDPKNPVTAVNPLTVAFHLTSAAPAFKEALSIPLLTILDKKAVLEHAKSGDPWGRKWLNTHSATFGPYQVSHSELPNKIVFSPNPHFYLGAAKIKQLTLVLVSQDSTRLATVLSGDADFGVALDPQDLTKIKSSPNVKAYIQNNGLLLYYLLFNQANSQVKNVNLRRALSMAVDRKDLVDSAFAGVADPVTGCLPSRLYPDEPDSRYENTATGDAAGAKKLLQSVPGEHAVSIGYATSTAATAMAQLVKENFEAIGVTTTLKPYASYTTFAADQASGKFGVGINGFGPFLKTPGYVFTNLLVSTSGRNQGNYKSPAMDVAANATMRSVGARQATATATACELMLKDAPIAMLGSVATVSVARASLSPLSAVGQVPLVYNMGNK